MTARGGHGRAEGREREGEPRGGAGHARTPRRYHQRAQRASFLPGFVAFFAPTCSHASVLAQLGRLVYARRVPVLVVSSLYLVLSVLLLLRGGTLAPADTHGIEAEHVRSRIEAELRFPSDASFLALFRSSKYAAQEAPFQAALTRALAPVRADPSVAWVLAPDDAPALVVDRLLTEDEHGALVVVAMKSPYAAAAARFPALREALSKSELDVKLTGNLAFRHDLDQVLARDLLLAELVSLPLALLVLLFVFRSAVAASVPVGVGALAVGGGIAAILGLSRHAELASYAVNVASLIGLGVAIDYSLFLLARYKSELALGASYEDALLRAMETAGRAVLFSGLAVAIGLSGLLFFRGSFLAAMGLAGVLVVALAVVFALTFLPALLAVLGPRIDAGRLPFAPREEAPDAASRWHRLARGVMAHPLLVLIPTLAVVLALGSPFRRLDLAAADVSTLPKTTEARATFEHLKEQLPEQVATRLLVLVEFPTAPALGRERAGALFDLSQRIQALPGITAVESLVDVGGMVDREGAQIIAELPRAELSPELQLLRDATVGERVVLLQATTDAAPASEEARAIVRALRAERSVHDGRLSVGGQTATDLDTTAMIVERAPLAIGFVVGLTYLVLLVVLRSVLLPLKALALNFLSIAASFGALVWVFQEGHFSGLLGFVPGPIEPTVPVLLFCTVFGLSMDYEVLMLVRMREEYERSGDNMRSVAEGLARTGRLVTSAAAIMVAVFAAFASASIVAMKALGVTLALAVVVDATLVRVLLVPATMRLFGDLNWWAPAPLAGLLARFASRPR